MPVCLRDVPVVLLLPHSVGFAEGQAHGRPRFERVRGMSLRLRDTIEHDPCLLGNAWIRRAKDGLGEATSFCVMSKLHVNERKGGGALRCLPWAQSVRMLDHTPCAIDTPAVQQSRNTGASRRRNLARISLRRRR